MDYRLLSLILILFTSFSSLLLLNSYYCEDTVKKGISVPVIGIILATYPLGNIYASVILGKQLDRLGRKKMLYIMNYMLAVAYVLFTSSVYISNFYGFVIVAVLARIT